MYFTNWNDEECPIAFTSLLQADTLISQAHITLKHLFPAEVPSRASKLALGLISIAHPLTQPFPQHSELISLVTLFTFVCLFACLFLHKGTLDFWLHGDCLQMPLHQQVCTNCHIESFSSHHFSPNLLSFSFLRPFMQHALCSFALSNQCLP